MKANLLLVLVFFIILGIYSVSAESSMNLTGKWVEEKIEGFRYSGELLNSTGTEDYWILNQTGNVVFGTNVFNDSTKMVEELIAGSIRSDGKTVFIVDSSGVTYIADITADDTLTINYINTGTKKAESNYAFALYQVLKREK